MDQFAPPSYEELYLFHLAHLLNQGRVEGDRTGTGTVRSFGTQLMANLQRDFPLLTTKKVFTRGIIEELLWFLRGETNIKSLQDAGVHIWDEWADDEGELGPVYGAQWRAWRANGVVIDQIATVIEQLRTDPNSRRILVSAWNPAVLPDSGSSPNENASAGRQALPPCHTLFQFFSQEMTPAEREAHPGDATRWLDLKLYQRSADWFLGVPFNAVSYSLLLMMVAHHVGMAPRMFYHTFGDFHLYANHFDQAQEQISREVIKSPVQVTLDYPADTPLEQVRPGDIRIDGYECHPAIKAPISK